MNVNFCQAPLYVTEDKGKKQQGYFKQRPY